MTALNASTPASILAHAPYVQFAQAGPATAGTIDGEVIASLYKIAVVDGPDVRVEIGELHISVRSTDVGFIALAIRRSLLDGQKTAHRATDMKRKLDRLERGLRKQLRLENRR